MREAKERLLYLTMNDRERQAYIAHMDDIMVQNDVLDTAKMEGRAEGRAEGEQLKAMEVARGMKADGLSVEAIARYTGLSVAAIAEL